MWSQVPLVFVATGLLAQVPPLPETGFRPIFNGSSLDGWDCDPDFWRAMGGSIVGQTTVAHQPKQNTFCIWKGGSPADFDLKLQYRITGGNSGIQYRSVELPHVAKWVMKGYQADIDAEQMYTGQVYEERGRTFLAMRGQAAYVPASGKPGAIGSLGDAAELKNTIKNNNWNDLEVIAHGNSVLQLINGRAMSSLIDDDKTGRRLDGEIGIQLHVTDTGMKIEVRNIRIKTF